MPATPCANCFYLDSVILVVEGEGDVIVAQDDGKGVEEGVEDVSVAAEGGIAYAERG